MFRSIGKYLEKGTTVFYRHSYPIIFSTLSKINSFFFLLVGLDMFWNGKKLPVQIYLGYKGIVNNLKKNLTS